LGAAAVAGAIYYVMSTPLPAPTPLTQTTFIMDASGHTLATYNIQNRVSVPLSKVPPVLIDAVVSTEDRHYFSEGAINPLDIGRALVSDLRGSGNLQGGSTITQQYVKQAYLTSQRTLGRKLKEAVIAIKLNRVDSKDQILQDYLNTIYFGRGAYGVQAAAQAYFGVDVEQVTLPEAALLAGLIREPDNADPAHDPTLARNHQVDTLDDLIRDKKITRAQAAAAEAIPMSSYVKAPTTTSSGITTDVPGDAYFLSAVRAELLSLYPASEVDGGGLRVTTTLDDTLQAEAYQSIYGPDALDPAQGNPSGALVSVDDQGHVRALVGGQKYYGAGGSEVDLALGTAGGGSGRQPGSTFKAFMLAEVIKEGYSPESTFPAPPELIVPHGNADGSPWKVTNFEGEAPSERMSLVEATAQSINTVYAQVVERIGPKNLDTMAESLGIAPSELKGAYPSQVLGSADVSPLEMAAAYATFANGGTYTSPVLITKVTKADGTPLPLPAVTRRRVLTPSQDAELTYVLQQVVDGGTGGAAGDVGSPVAGKTGTTDNSANAWFIGYTPKLTTAVWMGFPQGSIPMDDLTVDGTYYKSIQGGDTPADLWHNYMKAAIVSEPDLAGAFTNVWELTGRTLTPPPADTLEFPEGFGEPATTLPPATTTTTTPTTPTTIPTSTTVSATTTTATTLAPATTTPTTTPPATTTPTTAPATTTPTTTPPAATTPTTAPATTATTAPSAPVDTSPTTAPAAPP
jgi:membrane peptidoglycan carboxypeptidase